MIPRASVLVLLASTLLVSGCVDMSNIEAMIASAQAVQ